MTPDDRLKAALSLGAAEPPPVDPLFVVRIAERIEQRRFRLHLMLLALWAIAGGAVFWALRPLLGEAIAPVTPLLPAATAIAALAWIAMRTDPHRLLRRARAVRLLRRF